MAQFDQELRIADVYAEALFELAGESERVDEVRAELDELLKLWRSEPDFERFMVSPALEAEGRAAGICSPCLGQFQVVAAVRGDLLDGLVRAGLRIGQEHPTVEIEWFRFECLVPVRRHPSPARQQTQ